MRHGVIIQSRMGSVRYPGKSLSLLAGKSLLERLVLRVQQTPDIDEIVIATSTLPRDDEIENVARGLGVACYRGSESDVLGRFAEAARKYDLDMIYRACGDSPFTDPTAILAVKAEMERGQTGFVTARHDLGWPPGTSVDLITREALETAAEKATDEEEREHVIPYHLNNPELFGLRIVNCPKELLRPDYFLAVDYPLQLEGLNDVCRGFSHREPEHVPLVEILQYIDANPGIQQKLVKM